MSASPKSWGVPVRSPNCSTSAPVCTFWMRCRAELEVTTTSSSRSERMVSPASGETVVIEAESRMLDRNMVQN